MLLHHHKKEERKIEDIIKSSKNEILFFDSSAPMRTSMHAGTFQSLSGNTIYLLGEPSRSVYRHTSVFEMASKFEGKVQEPSVKPMVGTGNERKGSISAYPQEVKQCCTDVLAWMDEKGPNH